MRKHIIKTIRSTLLICFLLAAFLIAIGPQMVNDEAIRLRIAQSLEQASHQRVIVDGDIRIRFFPTVTVLIERVSIQTTGSTKAANQLLAEDLELGFRTFPFLAGRAELTRLSIGRLDLKLDAGSCTGERLEELYTAFQPPVNGAADADGAPSFAMALDRIQIRKMDVLYGGGKERSPLLVRNGRLEMAIGAARPFNLSFDLGAAEWLPGFELPLSGKVVVSGRTSLLPDENVWRLDRSRLVVRLQCPLADGGTAASTISAALSADARLGQFVVDDVRMDCPDQSFSARIEGRELYQNPVLSGKLRLESSRPGAVCRVFRIPPPAFTEQGATAQLGFSFLFDATAESIDIGDLALVVDSGRNRLSGSISVKTGRNSGLTASLGMDELDLDRWRTAAFPYASSEKGNSPSGGTETIDNDLTWFRNAAVDIDLHVGKVKHAGHVVASDMVLAFQGRDGRFATRNAVAQLPGGLLSLVAEASLDGPVPDGEATLRIEKRGAEGTPPTTAAMLEIAFTKGDRKKAAGSIVIHPLDLGEVYTILGLEWPAGLRRDAFRRSAADVVLAFDEAGAVQYRARLALGGEEISIVSGASEGEPATIALLRFDPGMFFEHTPQPAELPPGDYQAATRFLSALPDLRAKLSIGQLSLGDDPLQGITLVAEKKDGDLHLGDFSGRWGGADLIGEATLSGGGDELLLAVSATARGQLPPVLLGEGRTMAVDGPALLSLDCTAQGNGLAAMVSSLEGTLTLGVEEGHLRLASTAVPQADVALEPVTLWNLRDAGATLLFQQAGRDGEGGGKGVDSKPEGDLKTKQGATIETDAPLLFSLKAGNRVPGRKGRLSLEGDGALAVNDGQRMRVLSGSELRAAWIPDAAGSDAEPYRLAAGIAMQANGSWRFAPVRLRGPGLTATADVTVAPPEGERTLAVTGTLTTLPFNPAEHLSRWGISLYASEDPEIYRYAALKTGFSTDGAGLLLSDLDLTVDQSRLTGRVHMPNLDRWYLNLDLNISTLDLDRYLPEALDEDDEGSGEDFILEGKVGIGHLNVVGIDIQNTVTDVNITANQVICAPFTTDIHGGKGRGGFSMDFGRRISLAFLELHTKGMEMGGLLDNLIDQRKITGSTDLDLEMSWRGGGWDRFRSSLDGKLDLHVTGGEAHLDLGSTTQDPQPTQEKKGEPGRAESDDKPTPFREIRATAGSSQGLIRNNDLLISLEDKILIAGRGTIELMEGGFDYHIDVDLPDSNLPLIPYTVTGNYPDLKVSVNGPKLTAHTLKGIINLPFNVGETVVGGTVEIGADLVTSLARGIKSIFTITRKKKVTSQPH